MTFLIGLLTVVLVVDCLALIFLVLIQLPKKDAGAGLAFGGSGADALFGAGSGNALTKITKYATVLFFALAVLLTLLNAHVRKKASTLELPSNWQPSRPPAGAVAPAPTTPPSTTPAATTNDLLALPAPAATQSPAAGVPASAPPPATTNP
jgi:preprotein translocase subunit SecG